MTVLLSELRTKEVIRLCDAESIGCVADVEMDCTDGRICALCVMPSSGWGAFLSGERTVIPWERIRCIGRDTILADVPPGECCPGRGDGRCGWRERFFHKR